MVRDPRFGDHRQQTGCTPLTGDVTIAPVTTDRMVMIADVPVLVCAPDGRRLATEADATDLIGDAFGCQVDVVAVPVARLTDDFFALRTGLAGAIMQKFVNYHLRFVVVGDVSEFVAGSTALRDFVAETNRGRQVWFVADENELAARLGRA
jgi:Domain of unknown function (DUF4180)